MEDTKQQLSNYTDLASQKVLDGLGSKWFMYFSYAWFLFQSSYFAFTARFRIAPDAGTHLGKIKLFARDGLDPLIQNQEGFYFLGDMIRRPDTLYHYLLSLIYRASPFLDSSSMATTVTGDNTPTVILLRFTNIFIVLAGLYVFYRLMKRLDLSSVVRNISLFMMVNTIMFVFVASSLNYDNLLFLMTMVVFYFLIEFTQTKSLKSLLALWAAMATAGLVKISFLPLGLVLFPLTIYYAVKARSQLKSEFMSVLNKPGWKRFGLGILIGLVLITSGLFAERYVVNVARYGAPNPKCDQVHTIERCSQNAIFNRAQEFEGSKPTYELEPHLFTFKWAHRMRASVLGVLSHMTFSETKIIRYGSYAFIGLMTIAAIRKFDRKEKEINILLFTSVYFVFTLLLVNYFGAYMKSGKFGIALQGRYMFPVLPILYGLGNYYVFKLFAKSGWLKVLYSIFILLIFIPSSLLNYFFATNSEWQTKYAPTGAQASIKQALHSFNKNVWGIFK